MNGWISSKLEAKRAEGERVNAYSLLWCENSDDDVVATDGMQVNSFV